jgi:transposase
MLLDALQAPCIPDWMKTLSAVTTLRTMWEQQFEAREQGGQWRKEPVLPAAQLLASPYDLDARNGKKRSTFWTGYKVHFTQTCEEDVPQLITTVQTTIAPQSDEGVISAIHADLAAKELLPGQHLVDSGYVTIANLVRSQSDHEVDQASPHAQNALVSGGDRLRSHTLLHRLGS